MTPPVWWGVCGMKWKQLLVRWDLKATRSQTRAVGDVIAQGRTVAQRRALMKFFITCLRPLSRFEEIEANKYFCQNGVAESCSLRSVIRLAKKNRPSPNAQGGISEGNSSSAFNYPRRISSRCCAAAGAERSRSRGAERGECDLARASNGFAL